MKLQETMVNILPDAATSDGYLSTPEIHRRLAALQSHPPVVKTVQRWLEHWHDEGLVEREKRGTALVWRKRSGASGMAKASSMMSHDEALALQTLKRFSSNQIPALVAKTLAPMFAVAQDRLAVSNTENERRYGKWSDKVAVENGGFALQYPTIDAKLFAEVSQALFYERKLDVVYRARSRQGGESQHTVLPLGMVECGGLVYLVASVEKYPAEPALYRLDRLKQARMLPEDFTYPSTFRLQRYVKQQRQFDFMTEGAIRIALRFSQGAGEHLLETPMSNDQKTKRDGESLIVRSTVIMSQRLRWWLRSFGPSVEILSPKRLRDEFARDARELGTLYGLSTHASGAKCTVR